MGNLFIFMSSHINLDRVHYVHYVGAIIETFYIIYLSLVKILFVIAFV